MGIAGYVSVCVQRYCVGQKEGANQKSSEAESCKHMKINILHT
jgi:hypothetical protein